MDEELEELGLEDEAAVFDNLDAAIIGVTTDGVAAYSYGRLVRHFMDEDAMTEDDAIDWVDFNVIRSLPYMGAKAPVIIYERTLLG